MASTLRLFESLVVFTCVHFPDNWEVRLNNYESPLAALGIGLNTYMSKCGIISALWC